jgi:hypothetical protein
MEAYLASNERQNVQGRRIIFKILCFVKKNKNARTSYVAPPPIALLFLLYLNKDYEAKVKAAASVMLKVQIFLYMPY